MIPVAIKMPHSRWMSSGNEPMLDTRVILRKEFQLGRYLLPRGLPAPEAFRMHTEDAGVDFNVSQFVESDDSELLDSEFGRLIRAIQDPAGRHAEAPGPRLDRPAQDAVFARNRTGAFPATAFTGPAILPQQAKLRREPVITLDLWSR